MYRVVKKIKLTDAVTRMSVEAPLIAEKRKPGQFMILRSHEDGERIPLTIVDSDTEKGTVDIIFQVAGRSTREFDNLEEGDAFTDVAGPLGCATHIEKFGRVVCIGGGIGTAPILPITKAMKEKGNHVTSIVGARTEELLILLDEMEEASDRIFITTDDGSKGHKGFVTDLLKQILDAGEADLVVAIGPAIMMKFISDLTRKYGVKTIVSLNTIMIDGTGMCGGCRVTVGSEVKFTCVDGPEFDGHLVDFDELMQRQGMYKSIERDHICRLEKSLTGGKS